MDSEKDCLNKINVGGLLLLLSMKNLVAMPVPIIPSNIGSLSMAHPDTTPSSIDHGALGNNLHLIPKEVSTYEDKNQVIKKNLRNPNPSKNEVFHRDTQNIRKLLQYDNSNSGAATQSTEFESPDAIVQKPTGQAIKIILGLCGVIVGLCLIIWGYRYWESRSCRET